MSTDQIGHRVQREARAAGATARAPTACSSSTAWGRAAGHRNSLPKVSKYLASSTKASGTQPAPVVWSRASAVHNLMPPARGGGARVFAWPTTLLRFEHLRTSAHLPSLRISDPVDDQPRCPSDGSFGGAPIPVTKTAAGSSGMLTKTRGESNTPIDSPLVFVNIPDDPASILVTGIGAPPKLPSLGHLGWSSTVWEASSSSSE